MATFKINDMITSLENKSNELLDKIVEMEKNVNLSENTVRTQKQQKGHEVHNLLIIKQLCVFLRDYYFQGNGDFELPGDLGKWFESTTMLTETRKKGSIVFKDGDDLLEIMDAHPNVNYAKLKKMIEEQGFTLDGHTVRK